MNEIDALVYGSGSVYDFFYLTKDDIYNIIFDKRDIYFS